MPTISNAVTFQTRQIRFLILGVFLTLVVILLWSTDRSPRTNNVGAISRAQSKAELEYLADAQTLTDITQWGEMGHRVQLLARWADHVTHSREDPRRFQVALRREFSFLAGTEATMFAPWSHNVKNSSIGYVVCTGSKNYHLAAHLIRNLREVHKVVDQIEIAYAGDTDLKPEHREFLQKLGNDIVFIDLLKFFPEAESDLVNSGWAMKPFSMLASQHSHVILVDADALFLDSPNTVFESHPGFARTGTLFFHDRAAVGGDDERLSFVKAQLQAAGRIPSDYLEHESLFYSGTAWYEADSGVVVIDKTRPNVLIGLIWATWMNTKTVREQVSYRVFYGDKETFWVAMEFSGVEYSFQPWYAGTIGTIEDNAKNDEGTEICGTHMLHLNHDGNKPFWINGGVYVHKDDTSKGYMKMTHWWVGETEDLRDKPTQWYWKAGNYACVREKNIKEIPIDIQSNIEKIVDEAEKIDQSL